MQCPHCETENRDDRGTCYHCGRDLTLLRLIHNKAKSHFNAALEHVEDARYYEALGELNNAVELNSRFIEAHVLRGSILARLDRSDEAREALHRALALRPQAARAHRYLKELEDVHQATPLRRRLGRLAVVAGGVAVTGVALALGGLSMLVAGPGPVRDGWVALGRGDVAESRRKALEAGGEEGGARELLAAIDLAVETRLEAARRLSTADRPAQAVAILGELEGMELPEDLADSVVRERESIATEAADHFSALVASSDWEATDRAAVAERQASLEKLFPDSADELAAAVELRERAERARVGEALAGVRQALATGGPEAERAAELLEEARRFAEQRGVVPGEDFEALQAEVAQRRSEVLLARAEAAAEAADRAALEAALSGLAGLGPGVPEAAQARAEVLRTELAERVRARAVAELDAALESGETARVLAQAAVLEGEGVALDSERAERVAEARRTAALDAYYALMAMGERFEKGTLTIDEASDALGRIAQARGPMPRHLAVKAAENLHFFAASALQAAGRSAEAEKEIAALRADYPDSAWLLTWERLAAPGAEVPRTP